VLLWVSLIAIVGFYEQDTATSLPLGTQHVAVSSLLLGLKFKGMQHAEDSSPESTLVSSPKIGISPNE